jgi:hypothetical protein
MIFLSGHTVEQHFLFLSKNSRQQKHFHTVYNQRYHYRVITRTADDYNQ